MAPKNNPDLNANVPDHAHVALIIIDMINDLEFPGGECIAASAYEAAKNISTLKDRARQAGVPVIFANDNFGRWRSNFEEAIEQCLHRDVRGRPLVQQVRPSADDYFVLKPKHSAFYATPLELLLQHLGSRKLILCGVSANMCVQFTAIDAYMRDYELFVPEDCTASNTEEENQHALQYLARVLKADITRSNDLEIFNTLSDRAK